MLPTPKEYFLIEFCVLTKRGKKVVLCETFNIFCFLFKFFIHVFATFSLWLHHKVMYYYTIRLYNKLYTIMILLKSFEQ